MDQCKCIYSSQNTGTFISLFYPVQSEFLCRWRNEVLSIMYGTTEIRVPIDSKRPCFTEYPFMLLGWWFVSIDW